jgi:hypothetical protein
MPSAAWCTSPGCRWQDPVSVLGITLDEHDVAVEKLAEAHARSAGHEVQLLRTQGVFFRPAIPAAQVEAEDAHLRKLAAP